MLFRKCRAEEVVRREAERLKSAIVKIEFAKTIVSIAKRERADKLLMESAIVGIPASSRNIANLYMDSAFNDIEKTVKSLRKVEKEMVKRNINNTRKKIHYLREELEKTAHEETSSPQLLTLRLQKAITELEEIAKNLRKLAMKI